MSVEIYYEVMKLEAIYQKLSLEKGIPNNKQFFNLPFIGNLLSLYEDMPFFVLQSQINKGAFSFQNGFFF